MQTRISLVVQFILLSILISCKAYKPVVYAPASGITENDYISTYREIAISEMKRTGVPASITLAQGMIESDYGRSTLARNANNHFGIKCHNGWTGATVRHNDDRRNECFRKYRNPDESFYDHSDFLRTGSRYSFLFEIPSDDYKSWARGLKKAGYATNPDYANMLIRKIEQFNLDAYDRGYTANKIKSGFSTSTRSIKSDEFGVTTTSGEGVMARVPRVLENNRIQYIVVKDGDTREKIEEEFQLLNWELSKYNELEENFIINPGQTLYLQPKREKAEPGKEYYTVQDGDTMYIISQKFGVKLRSLYEKNRMDPSTEPVAGQSIWLRNLKPIN